MVENRRERKGKCEEEGKMIGRRYLEIFSRKEGMVEGKEGRCLVKRRATEESNNGMEVMK